MCIIRTLHSKNMMNIFDEHYRQFDPLQQKRFAVVTEPGAKLARFILIIKVCSFIEPHLKYEQYQYDEIMNSLDFFFI